MTSGECGDGVNPSVVTRLSPRPVASERGLAGATAVPDGQDHHAALVRDLEVGVVADPVQGHPLYIDLLFERSPDEFRMQFQPGDQLSEVVVESSWGLGAVLDPPVPGPLDLRCRWCGDLDGGNCSTPAAEGSKEVTGIDEFASGSRSSAASDEFELLSGGSNRQMGLSDQRGYRRAFDKP